MTGQGEMQGVERTRSSYETPEFGCEPLSLVTLGGSVGNGDSGAPNTETPFGTSAGDGDADSADEDWDW